MSNPELSKEYIMTSTHAYDGFLSGVAVLHSPADTEQIHNRDLDNPLEIVQSAQYLVVEGLKSFIDCAVREFDQGTGGRLQEYEERYKDLSPYMIGAIEEIEHRSTPEEIEGLVLPKPILDEQLYKYICHGRWTKLNLERLIFPVIPHKSLEIHAKQP